MSICPRCLGAYDSVLHALCEFEQQKRELADGSRDRITCSHPSIQLRHISARNDAAGIRQLVSR